MRSFRGALAVATILVALVSVGIIPGTWSLSRISADTYTIQEGDTLSEIAERLQITVSAILTLNAEITSPDAIEVGQSIRIPDNTATTPTTTVNATAQTSVSTTAVRTYEVQDGDTLWDIATEVGTTTTRLIELNPEIDRPNRLPVGAEIRIPYQAKATGPDSSTGERSLNAGIQTSSARPFASQTVQYLVQAGDSWSAIAEANGISTDALQRYNPDADFPNLHPGDVLNVPVPDYRAPAIDPSENPGGLTANYTARPGDNATFIAEAYGISLGELRQLNGNADLNIIRIGQVLTVPWIGNPVAAPAGTVPAVEVRRRTYRVQAGDNFSAIAAMYGLSLDELRSLNPLRSNDLLIIGEILFLPGTIDPPVVSEERTLWESDSVQYAAAKLGVTPHTLIANHGWVEPDQWLGDGTTWNIPFREGLLITVQPGDTLRGIANAHGVDMDLILADPGNGVDDPNAIVIGQEIILPFSMPSFGWPATGELTDPFGLCRSWDCSYRHRGLDIALDIYVPIVAAADGVVTFVGGDSALGLGWYIEIDHGNDWATTYAHLSEFAVFEGQEVSRGEVIGYNGNTGYSTGPHLHFEVRHFDWYVDPMVVLP